MVVLNSVVGVGATGGQGNRSGAHQGQTSREGEKDIWWTARTARGGTGHLGRTETQRGRLWTACGQRRVDSKNSQTTRQQPAHPQYANYWAPLTRKRHIPPHSAQPQHTNYWAPRTQKRHQQEHRRQQPTESSDPTQHAKGRTGDCPGPRKGATTGRNVTQGGEASAAGSGTPRTPPPCPPPPPCACVTFGSAHQRAPATPTPTQAPRPTQVSGCGAHRESRGFWFTSLT